jgi:hypothetical protein
MFDTQGRLNVFENFRVDRALPKFRKPESSSVIGVASGGVFGFTDGNSLTVTSGNSLTVTSGGITVTNSGALMRVDSTGEWNRRGWWRRLVDWWRDAQRIPIEQFFNSVRNSAEELEVVSHRLQGYLAAITQAKANGQTALAEQLEASAFGVRAETQLVALKKVKFIEEAQLVEFVKKAKKGLRLDWVANFTRVIPEAVVKAKRDADERHVFDNYVVLHFDPDKKAQAETAAEREQRKDPILFGVIMGRRRLYFVADWVDEFCDLTFDQVADALGENNIGALRTDFEARG